jgi:hypothetical protein
MTQAPASSARKRVGLGPSGSSALPSTQPAGLNRRAACGGAPLALVPALSERRRAENRQKIGVVAELRCECAIPNCQETSPAGAMRDVMSVAVADLMPGRRTSSAKSTSGSRSPARAQ